MSVFDTRLAACAIDIPGIRNMVPALLMRDGTYAVNPELDRHDRRVTQRWIDRHGSAFRDANRDLLVGGDH
ncbi:hypothetical protein [Gordonia sp. WA4-43]|uniref:hypothetical protein n=1 Tax=Gordonia sp. WA4-43 TaxID=2878678 RepID=UPI001CFA881B|nr:hypothetical protein [Gordonia sp. WA4-43]UCZ88657.1 hypothetical protein LEL84_16425 [Gordonia sp. WA4-43]